MDSKEKIVGGKLQSVSWREIEGRVAALRGQGGLLRIHDPLNIRPQYDIDKSKVLSDWVDGGTWSGGRQWQSGLLPPFVTVDEVARAGARSLVIRGWPQSIARIYRIGDRFEARPNGVPVDFGHYYIGTDDARSNADGKLRIYFEPGLRAGLNIGDQVVFRKATSVFSLSDDKQGAVSRYGRFGSFGFSLIEKLPEDA